MPAKFITSVACLAFFFAIAVDGTARAHGQATKSIFISIVDSSGKPVTDLKPEEVAVGEDSKRLEMTGFKAAASPLSIALLIDTTGGVEPFVQDFRRSLASFVKQIQAARPDSEIMLMEFGQAASPLAQFTTKAADLEKPISRFYPKKEASSSVLLEAIGESSQMLAKRTSLRRAIVILNLEPSNENSAVRPNQVVEALRKSGASVWAVSLQEGKLRNPTRDVVLPVLTGNTGGSREFIFASAAIEAKLAQVAESLLGQYEVTYVRPADAGTPKIVQLRVGRPGLTVRAPAWPPQ